MAARVSFSPTSREPDDRGVRQSNHEHLLRKSRAFVNIPLRVLLDPVVQKEQLAPKSPKRTLSCRNLDLTSQRAAPQRASPAFVDVRGPISIRYSLALTHFLDDSVADPRPRRVKGPDISSPSPRRDDRRPHLRRCR